MTRHKGYNNFNVPHYAASDTPAIRPRPPRRYPEGIIREKAKKQRSLRLIYEWVRRHFSDGDQFIMGPEAPFGDTYNLAFRTGVYRGLTAEGCVSRIKVDWLDGGHRIKPEVVTFYRHVTKVDADGHEVELPAIDFSITSLSGAK